MSEEPSLTFNGIRVTSRWREKDADLVAKVKASLDEQVAHITEAFQPQLEDAIRFGQPVSIAKVYQDLAGALQVAAIPFIEFFETIPREYVIEKQPGVSMGVSAGAPSPERP